MRNLAIIEPDGATPDCPKPISDPKPDPHLAAQGWDLRFLTDPVRADELITLYRELGFQVRAEPVPNQALDAYCTDCQAVCRVSLMIYTRSSSIRKAGGE